METSTGHADKTAHLERVRAARGEGVVLKRRDAPYRAGRPASGGNQRKFKFTQSATCRVLSVSGKKRSVEVGVLVDGAGETSDTCRSVGNVTISSNFAVPAAGALIEVRYLYYYPNGSLYQSIYQWERDDKTQPDTLDSLKRNKPMTETTQRTTNSVDLTYCPGVSEITAASQNIVISPARVKVVKKPK